jgi:hypothetical protein
VVVVGWAAGVEVQPQPQEVELVEGAVTGLIVSLIIFLGLISSTVAV